MNGFSNRPKILKGAFVEYGISIPPRMVCFQFNPETITRKRSLAKGNNMALLQKLFKKEKYTDLDKVKEIQDLDTQPETISFELRLDATDKLNDGDFIAQKFGIAPQLSTLELMMQPIGQSLIEELINSFLEGYSFTGGIKLPIILFVWGRKKILPVNITSMDITEKEFSANLDPTRATVTVSLDVIEGPNPEYIHSHAIKEAMSRLNIANIPEVANTIVPL